MYIAASINLVGQKEKLTGQMPKLVGKCPVTDCYYEHCQSHWNNDDTRCLFASTMNLMQNYSKLLTSRGLGAQCSKHASVLLI